MLLVQSNKKQILQRCVHLFPFIRMVEVGDCEHFSISKELQRRMYISQLGIPYYNGIRTTTVSFLQVHTVEGTCNHLRRSLWHHAMFFRKQVLKKYTQQIVFESLFNILFILVLWEIGRSLVLLRFDSTILRYTQIKI